MQCKHVEKNKNELEKLAQLSVKIFKVECTLLFMYLHKWNDKDFLEENHWTQNYISNSTDKKFIDFLFIFVWSLK